MERKKWKMREGGGHSPDTAGQYLTQGGEGRVVGKGGGSRSKRRAGSSNRVVAGKLQACRAEPSGKREVPTNEKGYRKWTANRKVRSGLESKDQGVESQLCDKRRKGISKRKRTKWSSRACIRIQEAGQQEIAEEEETAVGERLLRLAERDESNEAIPEGEGSGRGNLQGTSTHGEDGYNSAGTAREYVGGGGGGRI